MTYINARLRRVLGFTFTAATSDVLTVLGWHPEDGVTVETFSEGTLPAGLAGNTLYYVRDANKSAGTCKLAATSGGAAIDITDTGVGPHRLRMA